MFGTISPFHTLPKEKQDQILFEARTENPKTVAKKYYEEVGITENALYMFLRRRVPSEIKGKEGYENKVKASPKEPKKEKTLKKLTSDEVDMLKRLEVGTAGIDEMSRMVAVRVFKRMLQNPDDFRFIDFFRAELLRQKEQETKLKYKWTNELMARMFAGQLPPKICPNCGMHLIKEVAEISEEHTGQISIDGEIVDEG